MVRWVLGPLVPSSLLGTGIEASVRAACWVRWRGSDGFRASGTMIPSRCSIASPEDIREMAAVDHDDEALLLRSALIHVFLASQCRIACLRRTSSRSVNVLSTVQCRPPLVQAQRGSAKNATSTANQLAWTGDCCNGTSEKTTPLHVLAVAMRNAKNGYE